MIQTNYKSHKVYWPIKGLFISPIFYLSLFTHLVSLFLVLRGNLGYFFVFIIFYAELVIDYLILLFASFFIKSKEIQSLYKRNVPKFILFSKGLFFGIILLLFCGLIPFLVFLFTETEIISISSVLTNGSVQLVLGIYLINKLISFVTSVLQYRAGQRKGVADVVPFIINLLALIIFTFFGIFILVVLTDLSSLTGYIINVQLIAVSLLFITRALVDSTFSFMIEKENFPARNSSL